jgi:hypothetical protein
MFGQRKYEATQTISLENHLGWSQRSSLLPIPSEKRVKADG